MFTYNLKHINNNFVRASLPGRVFGEGNDLDTTGSMNAKGF